MYKKSRVFKKLGVIIILAAVVLSACIFVGCADYSGDFDDLDGKLSALEKRIDDLEKENTTMKDELKSIDDYMNGKSSIPLLGMGDKFTYSAHGIELYSIEYVAKPSAVTITFTITNIAMPSFPVNECIVARSRNITEGGGTILTISGSIGPLIGNSQSFTSSFVSGDTHIYFCLAGSRLPFVIFKI